MRADLALLVRVSGPGFAARPADGELADVVERAADPQRLEPLGLPAEPTATGSGEGRDAGEWPCVWSRSSSAREIDREHAQAGSPGGAIPLASWSFASK